MIADRPSRRRRADRGFSLVELIFALGIIAVVLFALISMILHTMNTKESMREQLVAKQAAVSKVEEIRAHKFAEILTRFGPPNNTFNVPGLTKIDNLPSKQGLGTITIDSSNLNILDVTVTLDWKGARGASSYSVRSVITK
jgi:prepilin-type N-terminal cleavage/methylation domain-containing protein